MDFSYEEHRISLREEGGKTVAEVTFPAMSAGVVNIDHTFVDDSLRGQGIAGKLMEAVAQTLRGTGRKAVPTCSYAVQWFGKHPEYADVCENSRT